MIGSGSSSACVPPLSVAVYLTTTAPSVETSNSAGRKSAFQVFVSARNGRYGALRGNRLRSLTTVALKRLRTPA